MELNTDLEKRKYPIGKFQKPNSITEIDLKKPLNTIENFGLELFDITNMLSHIQLNYKYRPNGWTIK